MSQASGSEICEKKNKWSVPVGVSNKHVHLSKEHVEELFGKGYELTPIKDLSQPGQYACKETVSVVGAKGMIQGVRILGPVRKQTQVELSQTDARQVGINAPLRESGDLKGTPGCILIGPKGPVVIDSGCIIAQTHVHLHTTDGERLGLEDGDKISILVKGPKTVCFHDVTARIADSYRMDFHLDTDEANAALVKTGDLAIINHKDIVTRDSMGNIVDVHFDNIKFIQCTNADDPITQEGLRLLVDEFSFPESAIGEIKDILYNPQKNAPDQFYMLAAVSSEENKVVGLATLYYLSDARTGYLEHLGIIKEFRNKRLGSYLYQRVLAFLEEEHPEAEGILLEVRKMTEQDNRQEFFVNQGAIPVDLKTYGLHDFMLREGTMLMYKPMLIYGSLTRGELERAFESLSEISLNSWWKTGPIKKR